MPPRMSELTHRQEEAKGGSSTGQAISCFRKITWCRGQERLELGEGTVWCRGEKEAGGSGESEAAEGDGAGRALELKGQPALLVPPRPGHSHPHHTCHLHTLAAGNLGEQRCSGRR